MRQLRLKELLEEEKILPPQNFSVPSPSRITMATNLPVWEDTVDVKSSKAGKKFPYNKQLNQVGVINCIMWVWSIKRGCGQD